MTYEKTTEDMARELVIDDAYEYAQEEGEIVWRGATRMEPGFWDRDLDIVMKDFHHEEEDGVWLANVEVYLNERLLLDREYSFWFRNGVLQSDYEDV